MCQGLMAPKLIHTQSIVGNNWSKIKIVGQRLRTPLNTYRFNKWISMQNSLRVSGHLCDFPINLQMVCHGMSKLL